MYVSMYVCAYFCICMFVYVRVRMCVYLWVCKCSLASVQLANAEKTLKNRMPVHVEARRSAGKSRRQLLGGWSQIRTLPLPAYHVALINRHFFPPKDVFCKSISGGFTNTKIIIRKKDNMKTWCNYKSKTGVSQWPPAAVARIRACRMKASVSAVDRIGQITGHSPGPTLRWQHPEGKPDGARDRHCVDIVSLLGTALLYGALGHHHCSLERG